MINALWAMSIPIILALAGPAPQLRHGRAMSEYVNYDGVTLAASQAYTTTLWGSGTSALAAGAQPTRIFPTGQGEAMTGGPTDDTFVVNSPNDTVTAGGGVDTVIAYTTFILPSGIQNLTLNAEFGTVNGVGNELANLIIADHAGETIDGMGGDDVLVSAGGDTFVFDANSGKDTIYDFHPGATDTDVVRLAGYGFTSFDQVKAAMTQVGGDVVLQLSPNDLIDFKDVQLNQFTAGNFELALNTSDLKLTFDDEFNTLNFYNAATGAGVWKTSYAWGNQNGLDSHTISGELSVDLDPSFAGSGTTPLGIDPFSVANGVASITIEPTTSAQQAALWNYGYTSGILSTEKSFAQTYGYFEIRADMPQGTGVGSGFWLVPADGSYSTELDAVEAVNDTTDTIHNTDHYSTSGVGQFNASDTFANFIPDLSTGFHTYGVLWTPQTLSWYVDGVEVASSPTPAGMDKPMYLIISTDTGGWAGAPVGDSADGASLQVDYVRAYSLDTVTQDVSASNAAWTPPMLTFQQADGMTATWEVNATQIVGGGTLGDPGATSLHVIGDFNGDGVRDLAFQAADGTVATWLTNGAQLIGGSTLGDPGPSWSLIGSGDFNGSGTSDLLFHNTTTGMYATWDISNDAVVGGGNLGVAPGFVFEGTGDLNGDGKDDILFKNTTTGDYWAWLMNDTQIIGGGDIGNPGGSFVFKALGDMNGDGKADILFEDASGNYASWDMNGISIIGGGNIGNPGGTWTFSELTDLNGDHKADILFTDASGALASWTLDDTHITGGGTIGNPGPDWHLFG